MGGGTGTLPAEAGGGEVDRIAGGYDGMKTGLTGGPRPPRGGGGGGRGGGGAAPRTTGGSPPRFRGGAGPGRVPGATATGRSRRSSAFSASSSVTRRRRLSSPGSPAAPPSAAMPVLLPATAFGRGWTGASPRVAGGEAAGRRADTLALRRG